MLTQEFSQTRRTRAATPATKPTESFAAPFDAAELAEEVVADSLAAFADLRGLLDTPVDEAAAAVEDSLDAAAF